MKQLRGICYNINEPYIGRIDAVHKNSYILRNTEGKECLICDKVVNFGKLFLCRNTNFNIGDIVKILPSATLIVLYEATSSDNALFVSEQCNNKCIMCPQIMKKKPSDFLQENLEIIDLIDKSPNFLGITGGEPTSEWDSLITIVKRITEKHPTTNNLLFFIYNHQLCVVPKELRRYCCKTISEFKMLYLDECLKCNQKDLCGGLFQTAKNFHSVAIKSIED